MARGGKRVGAGRPSGALTARTREVAEKALAEGISPLEVMLGNMRHFQQVALDAEKVLESLTDEEVMVMGDTPELRFKAMLAKVKHAAGLRQMAQQCASDAAGFMHPKLAAIEHTGANGGPIEMKASKEQRDAAVSAALRSSDT